MQDDVGKRGNLINKCSYVRRIKKHLIPSAQVSTVLIKHELSYNVKNDITIHSSKRKDASLKTTV